MSKIDERINKKGEIETFLCDKRLDKMSQDEVRLLVELLKESEVQNGNTNELKSILSEIEQIIKEGESGGDYKHLLELIELLREKIQEVEINSIYTAGEGIVIKDNVISSTNSTYIEKLISDYEHLKTEYDRLEKQRNELLSRIIVLEDNISSLKTENNHLSNDLDRSKAKYREEHSQVVKLLAQIKELEEELSKREDYKLIEQLRTELKAAKIKIEDVKKERNSLQIQVSKFQSNRWLNEHSCNNFVYSHCCR